MKTVFVFVVFCPGLAAADVIRAEFVVLDRPSTSGWLSIVFDPLQSDPGHVYLEAAGDHNFGVFSRDKSPSGWIDSDTLEWNLLADGLAGEISVGLPLVHPDPVDIFADSLRIVRDGPESYIDYQDPWFQRRLTVRWDNVARDVPEPEVWLLLAMVFVWLFVGCMQWRPR